MGGITQTELSSSHPRTNDPHTALNFQWNFPVQHKMQKQFFFVWIYRKTFGLWPTTLNAHFPPDRPSVIFLPSCNTCNLSVVVLSSKVSFRMPFLRFQDFFFLFGEFIAEDNSRPAWKTHKEKEFVFFAWKGSRETWNPFHSVLNLFLLKNHQNEKNSSRVRHGCHSNKGAVWHCYTSFKWVSMHPLFFPLLVHHSSYWFCNCYKRQFIPATCTALKPRSRVSKAKLMALRIEEGGRIHARGRCSSPNCEILPNTAGFIVQNRRPACCLCFVCTPLFSADQCLFFVFARFSGLEIGANRTQRNPKWLWIFVFSLGGIKIQSMPSLSLVCHNGCSMMVKLRMIWRLQRLVLDGVSFLETEANPQECEREKDKERERERERERRKEGETRPLNDWKIILLSPNSLRERERPSMLGSPSWLISLVPLYGPRKREREREREIYRHTHTHTRRLYLEVLVCLAARPVRVSRVGLVLPCGPEVHGSASLPEQKSRHSESPPPEITISSKGRKQGMMFR